MTRVTGSRALQWLTLALAVLMGVLAPSSVAAEQIPASLSDVRVTATEVSATLVLRSPDEVTLDARMIEASLGGQPAQLVVTPGSKQERSTMLVIDTSGSMGQTGMATVRAAVKDFLAAVPKDVKVGVVSFASTSGVDVAPTTDRAKVRREVASLVSRGETALYSGVQDAVKALGAKGERSIVLLSDGGDTVAEIQGGPSREESQRKAAIAALTKGKVRAEIIAFNSSESNTSVLKQFASAGGGSVASAANRDAVTRAFSAAARALSSQSAVTLKRPAGVTGDQPLTLKGTANGREFQVTNQVNLGDTAPVPTESVTVAAPPTVASLSPISIVSGPMMWVSVAVIALGVFVLTTALIGPSFTSARKLRVNSIEAYGLGRPRMRAQRDTSPSAISGQLIEIGERFAEGRESTTKTMALLERADLPWRAGEWVVLRLVAIVVGGAVGLVVLGDLPYIGLLIGAVLGFFLPPLLLRFLAKRRTSKFEGILPDVLMLVATSLSSGFSLLQALDAVGKDAAEPAAKEFSRALAESRIGADVSDSLDHMAARMQSENMRWAVMAIRIQREVGGNLAETLRITAGTLREREMLRRQVKALSAEGRLSAYVLIALPVGLFLYMLKVNYDYVSLLWTTLLGMVMLGFGVVSLLVGIVWMRNVVKIEV